MNLGFRHIHQRQQVTAGLEPFPARGTFKHYLDRFMFVIGIVQPVALLPQVIAIYGSHQTQGVSLATWLLLTFFNAMWAIYGAVHKDKPITIANVLLTVLDLAIVFGVLFY